MVLHFCGVSGCFIFWEKCYDAQTIYAVCMALYQHYLSCETCVAVRTVNIAYMLSCQTRCQQQQIQKIGPLCWDTNQKQIKVKSLKFGIHLILVPPYFSPVLSFAHLTFIIMCLVLVFMSSPLLFISTPLPSLLFVSVLDRHLPVMEHRQLPRGSEPALPFQSGMGPRYPPVQQVGYALNLSLCSVTLLCHLILPQSLHSSTSYLQVDFKILLILSKCNKSTR